MEMSCTPVITCINDNRGMCLLVFEEFMGSPCDGPLLNADWKCRVCGQFVGSHARIAGNEVIIHEKSNTDIVVTSSPGVVQIRSEAIVSNDCNNFWCCLPMKIFPCEQNYDWAAIATALFFTLLGCGLGLLITESSWDFYWYMDTCNIPGYVKVCVPSDTNNGYGPYDDYVSHNQMASASVGVGIVLVIISFGLLWMMVRAWVVSCSKGGNVASIVSINEKVNIGVHNQV